LKFENFKLRGELRIEILAENLLLILEI